MLVGHYAVALVAKRCAPETSIGTLAFAAMFADFAWCVFMLAGIEQAHFKSGMGAAQYLDATNIALSHSLLMDLIWGALLATAYFWRRRYPRGAWVVFLAVLSHWLLDFVSHRSDMPIAPGGHKYFGLGLWNSVPATLVVEGGFWLLAIVLYARSARPQSRAGVYAFWIGAALLTLVWYGNIAGPPPRNPMTAPLTSLVVFSLSVAWAYWVDGLRSAQSTTKIARAPSTLP
ncbi:MAG TPA: hypothetical protein VI488_09225 [Candidatus Angelobacter sp.]